MYGAHQSRIYLITHTVDISHFMHGSISANAIRSKLRRQLGLAGTTFIYVGRLWRGKGIDYLMQAYMYVQQKARLK